MVHLFHRGLLFLLALLTLPALAQNDPPARVGRLSIVDNDVIFRVDRQDRGGPASVNWPISSGAVLETGRASRAEAWIGSTAYRLGAETQIAFSTVDDHRVDLRQNGGSLAVSILDRDQVDDVAIDTPDGTVRFLTPGRYRIDVYSDRSELTVQAGRAVFGEGRDAAPVNAGQKLTRWNGGEQLDADRTQDAFDRWVAQRENASLASTSRRYVSSGMTGYQDLDGYGDWQTAPEYGAIWYPRTVADDWAPYRFGRWAWVAPWGWTWIDNAPWGFAPFHYGRWVIIGSRWAWVPGRIVPRPVYAPALVAWVGNPGWSLSFTSGSAPAVGWFPLAPREVYVPAYRYSPTYVRQINITSVRDVTVIDRAVRHGPPASYQFREAPRAVTVVPAHLVREGRPISAGDVRRAERQDLGRAPEATQAPSRNWLAPSQGATRPHAGDRSERVNRDNSPAQIERGDRPFRQNEVGAPRTAVPERMDSRAPERRWPDARMEGEQRRPDGAPGNGRRDGPIPENRAAVTETPAVANPGRDRPSMGNRGEEPGRGRDAATAPVPATRGAMPEGQRPLANPADNRREDVRRPDMDQREQREQRSRTMEAAPPVMRREERPLPQTMAPVPEVRREPQGGSPRFERQVMPEGMMRQREVAPQVAPAPQQPPQQPRFEAPRVEQPRPQPQAQPAMQMPREMPQPRMEAPRPMPQAQPQPPQAPQPQPKREEERRGPRNDDRGPR